MLSTTAFVPFLKCLHQHLPELFGWIQWCYKYHTEAELRFGNHRLTYSAGVQLGTHWSSAFFNGQLKLLDELGPLMDVSLQLWYLDAGTYCFFVGVDEVKRLS